MKHTGQPTPLGSLCRVIGGGTPPKNNAKYYAGEIPWATVRDMKSETITETECRITKEAVEKSASNIIPKGNVVIATRVGLGKVCLLGQDTAINQDLRGIVPIDKSALAVRFLFWWLKSVADTIVAEGTGATVQGVKLPFVKSLNIPLLPMAEQQRIVGILDRAFDQIANARANAEKNVQNARALFESCLHEAFSARTRGWQAKPLGEVATSSLGKMLDKSRNMGEPREYLRNANVRWFGFELSNLTTMRFLLGETAKYTAVRGDVLVCEGGYPGRAAIWNEDRPIHFQKALHRVRFDSPGLNKWFVYYLYSQDRSGALRHHFTGTGIQHFTGEALSRLEIPIPPKSDLPKLLSRLDDMSAQAKRLESIYQKKLDALDALKQSLLHAAFAGDL